MQFVAINWHVYLLTKSPLTLGLVGLFRGVPIIVCSLAGGVVADAVDRRKLLVVTQVVMLISAALLAAFTIAGLDSVWPIYVLSGLASAANAFDIPARQSLMPALVPTEVFPNAVSLGLIVFNVATIAGPAIAGFRSEEHTSELQSQSNLVCRLLLEKKNKYLGQHRLRHELESVGDQPFE